MPRIFVVRHGQTEWNAAGRLQGQTDTQISAHGRSQAERNGMVLANIIDPVAQPLGFISSPLSRARETMDIICEKLGRTARYDTDNRLQEVHYGAWQGQTWPELRANAPQQVAARIDNRWTYAPPGGESYRQLSERVLAWFGEIQHDLLVTAHGGVLRVLLGYIEAQPKQNIPLLDIPQDKILQIDIPDQGSSGAHHTIKWL